MKKSYKHDKILLKILNLHYLLQKTTSKIQIIIFK